MKHRQYGGTDVVLDDDGYFSDALQWTPAMAEEIAREEGIVLTEKHLAIINYLRKLFFGGEKLSIRCINHSGIATLKEFYSLFPGAPLKTASRIGGLPNPKSCV